MGKKSSNPDMTVNEAGRRGGRRTAENVANGELPADFYRQIGHMGGAVVASKAAEGKGLPKDFYNQIGHKGGVRMRELILQGKQAEKAEKC